jgi:hypothetical protein
LSFLFNLPSFGCERGVEASHWNQQADSGKIVGF